MTAPARASMMPPRRRRLPGFGVALPTSGDLASPENVFAVAERAEALGYDDVWVNDHLSVSGTRASARPTRREPDFFESLTTLAAVAGRQRRIGLAVHSLVLPLRDPRVVAKQLATIHVLSGGRLTVAPGIGSSREDYAAVGVPFERRGRLMDEHLRVLDAIFNDEPPVAYDGKDIHMSDGWFFPRPRTIELWITGDSEPGLERVVRWGTGWFSTGWPSLEDYARLGGRLGELLAAAGRDASEVVRGTAPFVCVARTHEEAAALVAADPRLARRPVLVIAGDPAEATERIAAFVAAGVSYVELRLVARDAPALLEMMELVAAEVLPAFR
ncbi:MAG TPA: TIGR03619 family F420-dependent LLM class oxidoreductase [Candidatus Limnocylindria bacterium]|nr:TIGR03619 family F420-dependent LLM class oxidoreductase [Candidatus Limnocylindria bacterium]